MHPLHALVQPCHAPVVLHRGMAEKPEPWTWQIRMAEKPEQLSALDMADLQDCHTQSVG